MYEYAVKEIKKVVDGDTVDIVIDLGFSLTKKERVRLAGIDTPEKPNKKLRRKRIRFRCKRFFRKAFKR